MRRVILGLFLYALYSSATLANGWYEVSTLDPMTRVAGTFYSTPAITIDDSRGVTANLNVGCAHNQIQVFARFSRFFSIQNSMWVWSSSTGAISGPAFASPGNRGEASIIDDEGTAIRLANFIAGESDIRIKVTSSGGLNDLIFQPDMENGFLSIKKAFVECRKENQFTAGDPKDRASTKVSVPIAPLE
jgi:hypothetical protein